MEDELRKFILWYWSEIDGKPPYDITSTEIIKIYFEDKKSGRI